MTIEEMIRQLRVDLQTDKLNAHLLLGKLLEVIAMQQYALEALRREFNLLTEDHALGAEVLQKLRHDHDVWVKTCKLLFGKEYDDMDVAAGDDDV